jgi:hypothetical protein
MSEDGPCQEIELVVGEGVVPAAADGRQDLGVELGRLALTRRLAAIDGAPRAQWRITRPAPSATR